MSQRKSSTLKSKDIRITNYKFEFSSNGSYWAGGPITLFYFSHKLATRTLGFFFLNKESNGPYGKKRKEHFGDQRETVHEVQIMYLVLFE